MTNSSKDNFCNLVNYGLQVRHQSPCVFFIMGFTGDDLTGSLTIRLVLCCSCTNCHQKHSLSPSPSGRAREAKHTCPEAQADSFTSSLGYTPAQSLAVHTWQQTAEAHILLLEWTFDEWRCIEYVKYRQQGSHDCESSYTRAWWKGERTTRNRNRGHPQ